MEYLERINSFIERNNIHLTTLRHSVRSAVLNLIIMEYCKNMHKVDTPVAKIEIPELKSILHLLDKNSIFIETLSNSLMRSLSQNEFIRSYLDELEIFKPENVELLNGFFDAVIINDLQVIYNMIEDKFSNTSYNFQEKIGLTILPTIKEDHISFIVEETALSMVVKIRDITRIDERNDMVVIYRSIADIRTPFTNIPLYLDMDIISNETIMDTVCFVYQLSYNKLMDSYVLHFENPSNENSIIEVKK